MYLRSLHVKLLLKIKYVTYDHKSVKYYFDWLHLVMHDIDKLKKNSKTDVLSKVISLNY
jgi:hypothetical protein